MTSDEQEDCFYLSLVTRHSSLNYMDVYDDGHLRVEHSNYYVACRGVPVKLPRTEFLIISRLARSPERIVSSEELWHHAWAEHKPFNPVSLHVYIYRLRRKLELHGLRIDTMINVGYRLLLAAPDGEHRP